MELNYQKQYEVAAGAAAYMNGSIKAFMSIAWERKNYDWLKHFIRALEGACNEAGPEWQFYNSTMNEVQQFKAKLQTIENGNQK